MYYHHSIYRYGMYVVSRILCLPNLTVSLIVVPCSVCSSDLTYCNLVFNNGASLELPLRCLRNCGTNEASATPTEESCHVCRSPASHTVVGEGRGLELRELPHTTGYLAPRSQGMLLTITEGEARGDLRCIPKVDV